jgi:hypothetical protein
METGRYRLCFIEEAHKPGLLLFDNYFKSVRQLNLCAVREFLIVQTPFNVIDLAPFLLSDIEAVIRLRNIVLAWYEFEQGEIILTHYMDDGTLLVNGVRIVRVAVWQII